MNLNCNYAMNNRASVNNPNKIESHPLTRKDKFASALTMTETKFANDKSDIMMIAISV